MSLAERLRAAASFDLGWSLIQRYSVLVRESGSVHERAAANFILTRLQTLEIPHEVFEPKLFLSVPRSGSLEIDGVEIRGKPPSFAATTGETGLAAPPIHVPAEPIRGTANLFGSTVEGDLPDLRGKIVITEGYPMPVMVGRFEAAGAAGQVYINPGVGVHWGICTPIWGAPDESQLRLKPRTPILAINRPDGDQLLQAIQDGAERVTLHTELTEGWFTCSLPVVHIEGGRADDDTFLLVHGHYDSWDIGIGDNAVGDATLLELARILHEHREDLYRSVRIAWWPAHSTGRYGGSTWYADNFGLDLRRNCVAAINIDSPGCRGATRYDEVPWMAETEAVCRTAIQSVTDQEPGRQRPLRAGDYSFNQIGISSFFMLLSNIPEEERARLGYYPVGGCGGDIAWHTEKDRLELADRENLERDLRVYLTAIGEFVGPGVLPLDYRRTLMELDEALQAYEALAARRFDISSIRKALDTLSDRLNALHERIEAAAIDPAIANDILLRLGRLLVPVGYSERPRFEHDPATPRLPIPRLARLYELEALMENGSARLHFVLTELRRNANEVAQQLLDASWMIDLLAPPVDDPQDS